MNEATQRHTCSKKVIGAYNDAVDAYNQELRNFELAMRAYIDSINRWTEAGNVYARCEVDAMNQLVMTRDRN